MAIRTFRLLLTVMLAMILVMPGAVLAEEKRSVVAVAAAAKPSVVGILVSHSSQNPSHPGDEHAAGTGFILRDGYIITNAHVIADAKEVQILWSDKTVTVISEVANNLWWDEATDIGVVRVDTGGRKPLPFADSDQATVGELVVAIGNPLGFRLGNTVTTGILSGVGRAIGSGLPFLQMDAAINPGNSGGPLLNADGQVLGINSAKVSETGVEGLALAIPGNAAQAIAEELISNGKVERVWLGLILDEDWKGYFGVPNEDGVAVALVVPDGPSGRAGLRVGDKLLKVDDQPIGTEDDVHSYLLKKRPGEQVTLTLKRRGQILHSVVTLGAREQGKAAAAARETEQGRSVLVNLTPDQLRDAADYGQALYGRSLLALTEDYTAISGSQHAILYTEFTYVARRVLSQFWQMGKQPGNDFVQAVGKEIRGRIEAEFEVQGEGGSYLNGATAMLRQGETEIKGKPVGKPGYAVTPDKTTATGQIAFQFAFASLDPAGDIELVLQLANGTSYSFKYTLTDLR